MMLDPRIGVIVVSRLTMVVASAIPACGNQGISPPAGPVVAGNVSALSLGSLMLVAT